MNWKREQTFDALSDRHRPIIQRGSGNCDNFVEKKAQNVVFVKSIFNVPYDKEAH